MAQRDGFIWFFIGFLGPKAALQLRVSLSCTERPATYWGQEGGTEVVVVLTHTPYPLGHMFWH